MSRQQEKPISNIQFVSQWTGECESPIFRKHIENSHSVRFAVVFTFFVWIFPFFSCPFGLHNSSFLRRDFFDGSEIYETFENRRDSFIKNESFSRVIFEYKPFRQRF